MSVRHLPDCAMEFMAEKAVAEPTGPTAPEPAFFLETEVCTVVGPVMTKVSKSSRNCMEERDGSAMGVFWIINFGFCL